MFKKNYNSLVRRSESRQRSGRNIDEKTEIQNKENLRKLWEIGILL
jgi:hypothetical protein